MKAVQILASLTLAALPLYIIRCKSFSWCQSPLPFTLLELFILATFFVWIIWRVSSVRKEKKVLQRLFKGLTGPLFWPSVLFLAGGATIAVFLSADQRVAAGIWKAYFVEPALFSLVVLDLSIEKKSLSWAIVPLLFSGLWLSVLAVWQAVTGTNQFATYAISQGRVTAVYTTPNALGLYLGPLTFLALGFLFELFRQKQIKLKKSSLAWYLIISLLGFILAIYLSKSRGAGLGVIVALLAFSLMAIYPILSNFWQTLFRFSAFFAVVAYLLLNIFVFVKIDSFVSTYKPTTQNSITARFCIWQATKKMLADRPITGAGLSAYQKVYPSYATCYSEAHLYPHNILLNFWTETGMVGLLAFLWVIYRCWKILDRFVNNFLAVGLLSAMVYIFIHGLVDVPYFKNDLAAEFWVLLSMAVWFNITQAKKS
ncbi:MAG: hypothetical protein A2126_03105 [Candidatus Woykebacteria bacterium GWB1_45_5]|uniref:O-antigen ligase-related domain-containing protein n=2 Tax=Candidatus Woykeibacteriota TaxID=1817899 RepID=A0A1G1W059_9BACT|nr:MAG: hypothetical protein A2113_01635 [Candidatus Woykebacteria bacterium GWA1_44_8]OGY23570.1 MAG: hypothetical protein A2126_03105 [Candidatus Woykebacteria bacterium GWB1_45_5]